MGAVKYECCIGASDFMYVDSEEPGGLMFVFPTGDSVLFEDPEKVEQLRDQLSKWLEARNGL